MVEELYIKRILSGESDAFRYFVRSYKDQAYSIALSIVKDEFKATDVVQEAFVKAFENLKSFKGMARFSTWFIRIVINEAYKSVQKKKVQYTGDLPEVEMIFPDELKKDQQRHYINEVLRHMPANESLVLRLFYMHEYSLKEIGEVTGWDSSKIKVTLHRARKTMKEKLTGILQTEVEYLWKD